MTTPNTAEGQRAKPPRTPLLRGGFQGRTAAAGGRGRQTLGAAVSL